MNTRKVSVEYRLGQWAKLVKERSESGLSIKAFCLTNGISENAYFYWQRKVREAACEVITESGSRTDSLIPCGFAEVKLTENPTMPSIHSHINIDVRGVRISASIDYSADKLTKLLREAVRSC